MLERRALGKQQCKQRQPLFALGPEHAQLPAFAHDRELVAVGAVAGVAALEVGGEARLQLGYELMLLSRARARLVLDRQLALAAEPARLRGELLLEQLHGRGAVGAQRERAARQLPVPGGDRRARGRARANAAEQRVALRQHARILAARSSAHGPQSGHELVEVRAAQRGRALHQLETVGREHAEQGTLVAFQRALERGTVAGNHLLGAPLAVGL